MVFIIRITSYATRQEIYDILICNAGKYFVSVHGIKYTPLGISIVFNHEMIAHRLLDHPDIDVNKKTCESTALHYAALRNSVSLIEAICAKVWILIQIIFMLTYKMLPMQPDVKKNERDFLNGGLTPLMVAVKHKHVEAVRKMVKLKVYIYICLDCQHHVT